MSKDHHIILPKVNQKAMDNIDLIKVKTNELIYALGLVTQKGNTEFEKKLNENIEFAKKGVLELAISIISNYSVNENYKQKNIN